ncbi:hypothetical protein [Streptomyces sp. NPDC005485]|uniref:hypothetical protein n=1 Tax=Streptomyces sp. NPDC005485 TaxID=3155591 RepID=UPI0033A31A43
MAEHENSAALDALLAAITDEPLPEGAHDDPEFATEHRAAVADMALLREQLALLGDALAEPVEEAGPVRVPRRRARRPAGAPRTRGRRPLALAMGALVAVCVTAALVGMGWLLSQAGGSNAMSGADDAGSKADSSSGDAKGASVGVPGYLACARLVVEGTVADIEPMAGDDESRVTLDVSHYYKPAKGSGEVNFVVADELQPPLRKGQHALITIMRDAPGPDHWTVGEKPIARERQSILDALPESKGIKCQ